MRILHLLPSPGFGGAERVACTLHRLQLDAGHTSRLEVPPSETLRKGLERDLGALSHVNPSDGSSGSGWLRAARRRLAAFQPDVVHLHLPSPSFLGQGLFVTRGWPCVATFHLLPRGRFPADRLLKLPSPWILRGCSLRAPKLHCVTVAKGDQPRLAKWVAEDRLHCVVNAPPLSPVSEAEDSLVFSAAPPGAIRLLTVGRLVPQKGVLRLVDAMSHPRLRDLPWHWSVIGDGPERELCVQRVESWGLANKVSFLGAKPAHRAYAQADVLLSPSLYEGLPLVLLEALAAKLPLLVSDINPHRELLGAGSIALLSQDPNAWPEAIIRAISEASFRQELLQATRGCLPKKPYETLTAGYHSVYLKAQS